MRFTGRWSRFVAVVAAGLTLAGPPKAADGADAEASPAADVTVLGIGGYWRQHVTRMAPLISAASAEAAGVAPDEESRRLGLRYKKYGTRKIHTLPGESPPPPDVWSAVGLDDRGWVRAAGPFTTDRQEIGLMCRRGRFRVEDPAGVGRLTLQLGYRGGVIVYLNGHEVLRACLPEGAIRPRTPGDDYPEQAFFVQAGKRAGEVLHPYTDRKAAEQWALRERSVGPVELPLARLRKGVNVLAVEVHASNYPAACRKAGMGYSAVIGLTKLFLRAAAPEGAILPAVARPQGLQAWNAEVAEEVIELDYGDPCEPLRPMRILAVRNGRFSGQVVIGSTAEIEGLSARMGDLKHSGGRATIPATAVKVRCGLPAPGSMRFRGGSVYGGPTGTAMGVLFRRFDGLVERPPATVPLRTQTEKLNTQLRASWGLPAKPTPAAVVPVWVSVHVPAGAAAGLYKGRLSIALRGEKPIPVPVELEVFGWTLPDAAEYVSELSVYQSPDTLAAYYNVPLWSRRHWELIERSVRLIGQAGNHTVIIPLLSKEQVGNAESYVYWVRQPDGSFRYDTTVMDKYLDLYLKYHHARRIRAVCFIVWGNAGVARGNPYKKEKYDRRGVPKQTRGVFTVTMLDPKTGARTDMALPPIGSDAYEAFWRPVLLKVRLHLKKRLLAGKMLLGMPADPHPAVPAVAAFHNILPDVGWFIGNHPGASRLGYDVTDRKKFVPVVHVERVYTGPLPDPAGKRKFGWRRKDMALAFNRYGFGPLCLFPNASVWAFRILMEADLASGHRGAGRIGADYWKMPGIKYNSGGGGTFYARYPASSIGQTGMGSNCAAMLAPGPDGPVTSVRFENVREGIQAAEAVIFLEKALLDGKISGELAARCWRVIDERINAMRTYTMGLGRAGWQQRDRRLFQAAEEVAEALAGSKAPARSTTQSAGVQ